MGCVTFGGVQEGSMNGESKVVICNMELVIQRVHQMRAEEDAVVWGASALGALVCGV